MYWWIWMLLCVSAIAITAAITYRLAWWRIARRSARRGYELGRRVGYVDAMTERRKQEREKSYQVLWKDGMLN